MSNEISRKPERSRIADKLRILRKRQFVGRQNELEMFGTAVAQPDPAFVVLHLHGPGGIGKSTLLREFARLAREAEIVTLIVDAHDIAPSTKSFIEKLGVLLNVSAEQALTALFDLPRVVLLMDTYERFAPIDDWLRSEIIENLAVGSLVVLSGRNPPSNSWHKDGWSEMMHTIALRNLLPDESRAFLSARGVAADRHDELLTFTHGHPLGLTLLTEVMQQSGDAKLSPDAPDVIATLVNNFLKDVPSRIHQLALQTCAHARVTTEPILREVLGVEDANPYFDWLRSLSFIESHASGLVPHDLARDVIDRDLEWRDPEGFKQIHIKLRHIAIAKTLIPNLSIRERLRAREDIIYSQRYNPVAKRMMTFEELGVYDIEIALPSDHPQILAAIEKHWGEPELSTAKYWLKRQPEAWYVIRKTTGLVAAFGCTMLLSHLTADDYAADPTLKILWDAALQNCLPLNGALIWMTRFKMETSENRVVQSALYQTIRCHEINLGITTPNVGWLFIILRSPEEVAFQKYDSTGVGHWTDINIGSMPCTFNVVDMRTGFMKTVTKVNDTRTLDRASKPEHIVPPEYVVADEATSINTLSEPEFASAVKQALKDYTIADALKHNPLLRSRVLNPQPDAPCRPNDLQDLLREAATQLNKTPKDEKFYKAVWHTYIQPAATQELAADLLGLPFNTYRYQLERGVERIVAWMWKRELG